MTDSKKDFSNLMSLSKKAKLMESISFLLEWDQETYMPKEGSNLRAEQLELMASLIHKERTNKKFASSLDKMIDIKNGEIKARDLPPSYKAALKQWRRDYLIAHALPNKFIKNYAKLCSESMTVWAAAKKENNFKKFAPYLKKIVKFSQKKAEYLGYEEHPYDALIDCYEPDTTTEQITTLFNALRPEISSLLKNILASKEKIDDKALHGEFSTSQQMAFGEMLLKEMGYDLNKGRLDLSNHPFSMSLHPSDSRVTTRIHPTSLFDCISAVLHEGGHSLYEMGLLPEYYGSPLCEASSFGIHESQSRLWETCIGQCKPFWEHYLPFLQKSFPQIAKLTTDQFYRAINKVTPSCTRVEADEVTYSLHIILRFEIEKGLIDNSIDVKDVPEIWNAKMKEYLGICPKTDAEGCLQDIHWSMGGFGYFPTYTLGNIYASQFFHAFEQQFPSWEARVSQGDLIFLKEWLNDKIHKHGRALTAAELVKHVCGTPPTTTPYTTYLTTKYTRIYKL